MPKKVRDTGRKSQIVTLQKAKNDLQQEINTYKSMAFESMTIAIACISTVAEWQKIQTQLNIGSLSREDLIDKAREVKNTYLQR